MGFFDERCDFRQLTEELIADAHTFDCGNADLNDFFQTECIAYSNDLMGKTYCFTLTEDPRMIVCAFTISNDSIKMSHLPNARRKKVNKHVAREKQKNSYPAVLIGRLGMHKDFHGNGYGKELMDFIKAWFVDSGNKTGCRFVVVDAYNEEKPLKYYHNCGFEYLIPDEQSELKYTRNIDPIEIEEPKRIETKDEGIELNTRLMFFDLITLKTSATGASQSDLQSEPIDDIQIGEA